MTNARNDQEWVAPGKPHAAEKPHSTGEPHTAWEPHTAAIPEAPDSQGEPAPVQPGIEKTPAVNRNYKDSLFFRIFNEPAECLSLYNAVNGTDYTDVSAVRMTTLVNAVYLNVRNDVSCLFLGQLSLFEQQSTINPNMPYRMLQYLADILSSYVESEELNVFGETRIQLPRPQFVVFYNGRKEQPDQTVYRLSDLYAPKPEALNDETPEEETPKGDTPELELYVTVLNINSPMNADVVNACPSLLGYVTFTEQIRKNQEHMSIEEATNAAIDYCIANGYLADLLSQYRSEVLSMCLYNYDAEYQRRLDRRDAKKEGVEEGRAEGRAEGLQKGILISVKLLRQTGMASDEIVSKIMPEYDLTQIQAEQYVKESGMLYGTDADNDSQA